jgi:dipeptidyl aminopeptidase/acylaminoacyl peptidase
MTSNRCRRPSRFLVALAVLAASAAAAHAAPKEVPQYTIEDFLATTNMNGADFSPDGAKILVSSDKSGVFNAWAVPVAGGDPVQLTRSTTNAVFARAWYPKDERFIYQSDQGGNELTHVYVQTPDGATKDVTPGDKLKAEFAGWAYDDKSFFVATNERDKRYFDLYEVDPETYRRVLVYQDTTGLRISEVSRDKRWFALTKTNTEHDSNVYLYDRETKALTLLTPHAGDVNWDVAEFGPDDRSLYLLTDEGNEFRYLVRHDIASGQRTVVEKPSWDVLYAGFSKSGQYFVAAVNNDARTEIRLYQYPSMQPVQLPKAPAGDIVSVRISDDDSRMAFYLSGSRWPANLWVGDLAGGAARQLTQNLSPRIDPEHLVDAQVVRFEAADGVEIPGLLFKPHQASAARKVPALVNVHGGPGGQSRLGYSALVQYLVNHGYAVYSINNRGSSGYGKTFFKMDDRKHGQEDLDDCVASKKMLVETGWVDGNRIGILGGSYGGYMVLAALAFRPQEFAVGVDIFGVSNWVRTLESIPAWWEAQRKALYVELGDPSTDGEYLRSISPLFHAKNIARPLLVLQGKNDPRVLQVESDEIVAAAKANGVPVDYLVFVDEGHGFRNKKNQHAGYKRVLEFCDKYLAAPAQIGVR